MLRNSCFFWIFFPEKSTSSKSRLTYLGPELILNKRDTFALIFRGQLSISEMTRCLFIMRLCIKTRPHHILMEVRISARTLLMRIFMYRS